VAEDACTAGFYRASFLLALEWAGWAVGEPHVQTGMTLDRSLDRKLKDVLLRCHYVSAFDLADASLDRTLTLLEARGIRHLWGYPGSLYYLARRAKQTGWNRSLTSLVTWGDMLYPHYRKTLEETFGARVTDTYGCGEGVQVAAQCGADNAYHIHSLDVIVEFVDRQGKRVSPGTPGHVLLTRLHPGPMPLIRYAVGDMAVAGARACACGRGFEVMEAIQGRDTDVVITPSGNRLIVHFFTGVLEHFDEVASFQVVQSDFRSLGLRLVTTNRHAQNGDLTRRIVGQLREKGLLDMDIHVEMVDEIPAAPSGKRRFVVSHVNKSFH
jgi:phenylacetate-CoA ligase